MGVKKQMTKEYEVARHSLRAQWIASSITPEEASHFFNPGLEIDDEILQNVLIYRCSNCNVSGVRTSYCPNCGAIMDWKEE